MERFCLECNSLLKGRIDKKFCDDQCRSNYNYRLKTNDRSLINRVNQILKRNRKILKTQLLSNQVKIRKSILVKEGFDFNFFTHTYTTKQGNIHFFCYDYGYLADKDGQLLLIKKDGK